MRPPQIHDLSSSKNVVLYALYSLCLLAFASGSAGAAVVVTITEVGSDVQMSGTGTINLSGLTFNSNGTISPLLQASDGSALMGSTPSASTSLYQGATGPGNFGSGGFTLASSGSGPALGVVSALSPPLIYVPASYVSGTSVASTASFTGKSYASLGLTFGVYVYTWSSDTLTVIVGLPAAPVLNATPGASQVQLSWTEPAANGPTITGYTLQYRPVGGSWNNWSISGLATSATVTGLQADTSYEFSVAATNSRGSGAQGLATATVSSAASPAAVPLLSRGIGLALGLLLALTGGLAARRVHGAGPRC